MNSPTLFDAQAARDDAIERADHNADPAWKEAAFAAVICAASAHPDGFTSDDCWDRISPEFSTHEPSALGPVIQRCARVGLIVKTGFTRLSRLGRTHRDLTVWRQA